MSEPKVNIVSLVIGGRNRGKTSIVKNDIVYPSPLPKKLIIDTFDNPVWRNLKTWDNPDRETIVIPVLLPSEINTEWKEGLFRAYSSDIGILFDLVAKDLWNAVLVIEDATRFISNVKAPKNVMSFVYDAKQRNLNVAINFHSLIDVPANLVRAVDYITLFKTNESKCPSKFEFNEDIERVFDHLRASDNPHENVTIYVGS